MSKLNCLIVDDEPIAREIIETYCNYLPSLKVVGLCANAFEAKEILREQKVDILFLDINMPVLDGIAFLKTLKTQAQVIFTTAYKEYASDAFDLSACDYLLKPFSLERFIIAVDKASERIQPKPGIGSQIHHATTEDFVFIRVNGKIHQIKYDNLLFAEAMGNNTKVVTAQRTYSPTITFSSFEQLLPASLFLRVHRSFIINKSKITHIEGNRIFIDTHEIAVGSSYREGFLKELGLL
jgi:DNA-binding LytR/AlgR family response regulator